MLHLLQEQDDDLPSFSNLKVITVNDLYDMFTASSTSKAAVDFIYDLSGKSGTAALDALVDLSAEKILGLIQKSKMTATHMKI